MSLANAAIINLDLIECVGTSKSMLARKQYTRHSRLFMSNLSLCQTISNLICSVQFSSMSENLISSDEEMCGTSPELREAAEAASFELLPSKSRNALDNKDITMGIFLDLSKAFDCGDHTILLDKLYKYYTRCLKKTPPK